MTVDLLLGLAATAMLACVLAFDGMTKSRRLLDSRASRPPARMAARRGHPVEKMKDSN